MIIAQQAQLKSGVKKQKKNNIIYSPMSFKPVK